ncbi:MAG: DUF4013 domain-containing protein [Cyanobacteria bacterium]|nr:DUF4013 domain-containing protein [Cyanobacteriota bacterium]
MSQAAATPDVLRKGIDPDMAVRAVFDDPAWMSKALFGASLNLLALIILIFNPLFIPLCFCLWAISTGYVLKHLRGTIADRRAPLPSWSGWMDLFVSGMSWLAVITGFGFLVWAMVVGSLLLGATIGAIKTSSTYFIYWAGGTFIGLAIFGFVLNFLLAVLMANFAAEENMRAAFSWIKVCRRVLQSPNEFICAWMIGVGLQALAVALPVITILGIVVLPTAIFVTQLISVGLIGHAWAAGAKDEVEPALTLVEK